METKKFEKENKNLENKYESSNNQLTESVQKNQILENQLIKQQNEIEKLTNRLIIYLLKEIFPNHPDNMIYCVIL